MGSASGSSYTPGNADTASSWEWTRAPDSQNYDDAVVIEGRLQSVTGQGFLPQSTKGTLVYEERL